MTLASEVTVIMTMLTMMAMKYMVMAMAMVAVHQPCILIDLPLVMDLSLSFSKRRLLLSLSIFKSRHAAVLQEQLALRHQGIGLCWVLISDQVDHHEESCCNPSGLRPRVSEHKIYLQPLPLEVPCKANPEEPHWVGSWVQLVSLSRVPQIFLNIFLFDTTHCKPP